MQDGNSKLLLALFFLLGVMVAGLVFGLTGEAVDTAVLALGAGAGLFGLGLGIGGLYVGLAAARRGRRRRSPEPPLPRRSRMAPPAIGESLPTVTDYYLNTPDGEPLRRSNDPGRRRPDLHWMPETASGEDPDRPADA